MPSSLPDSANRPALAIVLGSATPPGRLRRALDGAADRASARADVALVDLGERRIGPADGRPLAELDDDAPALVELLAGADAVVLATPVYRGSFTGTLKNLLDLTPVEALQGTPVGLVAMGASPHHFLGADRHLRDVLAFFGAFTLPVAAYLTSADFGEDGLPKESGAAQLDEALGGALDLAASLAANPVQGTEPLLSRLRRK